MALTRTTIFYVGLPNSERNDLIDRFNSPENEVVFMILPYDAGSLGFSLQGDCHGVVTMISVKDNGANAQTRMKYLFKSTETRA